MLDMTEGWKIAEQVLYTLILWHCILCWHLGPYVLWRWFREVLCQGGVSCIHKYIYNEAQGSDVY